MISKTCAYNAIAGEADDPYKVLAEIRNHLNSLAKDGLSYEDFLRSKRVMYAEFLKSFDSTDDIANNMLSFFCEDAELLSYAEIIDSISYEYITELFSSAFDNNSTTLSIVYPTEK